MSPLPAACWLSQVSSTDGCAASAGRGQQHAGSLLVATRGHGRRKVSCNLRPSRSAKNPKVTSLSFPCYFLEAEKPVSEWEGGVRTEAHLATSPQVLKKSHSSSITAR